MRRYLPHGNICLGLFRKLALVFLIHFTTGGSAYSLEASCQVEHENNDNFRQAQFRMWVPDRKRPIKAVVVLILASKEDGVILADPRWKEALAQMECGVLTCNYSEIDSAEPYYPAERGSGKALFSALKELSFAIGDPKIADLPVIVVGVSEGGQFAYSLASWKPERVMSFISIKGSHFDVPSPENARSIPGLFFLGEKDAEYRKASIKAIFEANRKLGAPWCLAVEKNSAHDVDNCPDLIVPFLSDLLEKSDYSSKLRHSNTPAPKESSNHPFYLGSLEDRKYYSINAYPYDPSKASWLPGLKSAEVWQAFENSKRLTTEAVLCLTSEASVPLAVSEPQLLNFGQVGIYDKSAVQVIMIKKNEGSPPWDSLATLPSFRGYFSAEVKRLDSNSYKITVKPTYLDRTLGITKDTLPIRMSLDDRPILGGIDVPITAEIVGDLTANPRTLYLSNLNKGEVKTIDIVISSYTKRTLVISSVKCTPHYLLQVKNIDYVGSSAIIHCDYSGLESQGAIAGTVEVSATSAGINYNIKLLAIAIAPN